MVAMGSPRCTRSLVSTIHAVSLCRRLGLLSCLSTWPHELADMAGTRPQVVTMSLNTVPPVDCKCAAAAAGLSSRLALSERFVAVLSTPLVEQPSSSPHQQQHQPATTCTCHTSLATPRGRVHWSLDAHQHAQVAAAAQAQGHPTTSTTPRANCEDINWPIIYMTAPSQVAVETCIYDAYAASGTCSARKIGPKLASSGPRPAAFNTSDGRGECLPARHAT